jgi:hypothetical protein
MKLETRVWEGRDWMPCTFHRANLQLLRYISSVERQFFLVDLVLLALLLVEETMNALVSGFVAS